MPVRAFPMEFLHPHFELLVNSPTRVRLLHRASQVEKKWDGFGEKNKLGYVCLVYDNQNPRVDKSTTGS